jgi:hypothetical protein
LSALQHFSFLARKPEGGFSTCCETDRFEKRCKVSKGNYLTRSA